MKSLKKNMVLNAFRTAMTLIFPLITFPYSSRILNPETIGKVQFSKSIVSYFAMLAALGIGTYGIREASKLRENKTLLSHFFQELLLLNLISTIIAYIGLFLCTIFIPKLVEYRLLIFVTSSTILFSTIGIDWLYTAEEDFTYITIRSLLFQILSIVFLYLFVKNETDYIIYALITVFSSVGSNICNIFHAKKFVSFKIQSKLDIKQHIRPVFALFSLTLASSIYALLDTTMVGLLADDFQVGLYTAATKINKMVLALVISMGAVLLPRLSFFVGKDDIESFKRVAYNYLDAMLLIAFPCLIGLSFLSKPILLVLSGSKFIDALTVMRIMNPIIVIIGLSNFIGLQIFLPLKKEKLTLYSEICGAFVNFLLNLFLIPKYAAIGAAIATVCAESTVTIVQLIFSRNIISPKKILFCSLKYFVYSLIMGIPVLLCTYLIPNIIIQLIISIIVGILTYLLILFITKNELLYKIIHSIQNKLKGINYGKNSDNYNSNI